MGYEINRDYIRYGNSRSGESLNKVRFIVAHDTGNPGSTARQNRNYFDTQQPEASAQTFIDDTEILEIIPLNEKAWHVRYSVPKDNEIYGCNANDAAIGVELCFGSNSQRTINFNEAYKRYVWYLAYLCEKYDLNPRIHIIGHETLDPSRKVDPSCGLRTGGKTFKQLIDDVAAAMNNGNTAEVQWTSANNPYDGSYGILEAVGGGVNYYSSPYEDGEYRGNIQPGTPYLVYGEVNGYYGMGGNVWIPKKYVDFKPFLAVVTPAGGVNVFDAPSWKANYKGTLAAGVGYTVYAEKDGWYLLGGNVWVDGKYIMIQK